MKALLTKDFIVIFKQLKYFLFIIPILAITNEPSMTIIAIMISAMIPMTAIAYDEQSKWNELAIMLPYSKKQLVFSKYALGYLCMLIATILFLVAEFILSTFLNINISNNLFMLKFAIVAGLLLIAINIPIALKFGSQKGRFIFIILIGLIGVLGSLANNLPISLPNNYQNMIPPLILTSVLIINIISIEFSLHIKKLK